MLWRESDQTVWWTDILGRRIHRLGWPSLKLETYATPERAGALAFVEGRDDVLLVAFESGFALFAPATGKVLWLCRPSELGDGVRLNDGRVDSFGRFWAGSMCERSLRDGESPPGILYRLGPEGQAQAVISGIGISNGLSWSPDDKRMYFADSTRGQVYAASFNASAGAPGLMTPFAHFSGETPDGATVDAEGCYWTALWGGGRVVRLSPKGAEIDSVAVAAPNPSCPTFGGANLGLLFVTSARDDLDEPQRSAFPLSGSLFVYETNAKGVAQARARLSSSLLNQVGARDADISA